ncbi:hypothetical protein BOX30_09130 [Leptospirillum ferriphilum]|nr:hypothetical protein BOX30_09130 [Leptospirillum ferriphilum]
MVEKIVFDLTLRAEAPLAVSPIDSELKKNDRIRRLPRVRPEESAPVYFPSGTLRRALRHHAVLCLLEGGPSISLAALLVNAKGHVCLPDKPDKSVTPSRASTLKGWEEEQRIRRLNPLLDLFGAGIGFPGTLSVGHAWPPPADNPGKCVGIVGGGTRTPLDPDEVGLLSEPEEYFDFLERLKSASKKKSAKAKEESSPEDDKDETLQLQTIVPGHEVIVPGTELSWRIALSRATPAKIGLVLAAFRKLSEDPVVGAHKANGDGLFSLSGSAVMNRQSVGTIRLSEREFFVDGVLGESLDAWDALQRDGFRDFDFSAVPLAEERP